MVKRNAEQALQHDPTDSQTDEEMEFIEEEELEEIVASDHEEDEEQEQEQVFIPGSEVPEGFTLEYDSKSYEMMHSLNVEWPCLSFDIVPDGLGFNRSKFPHCTTIVTGTQAANPNDNQIYLLTANNLSRTKYDDDSDSDSDSETETDPTTVQEAQLEVSQTGHPGSVNRIRLSKGNETKFVASHSESQQVFIWDLAKLKATRTMGHKTNKPSWLHSIGTNGTEGWAIDWNQTTGALASGFCNGRLVVTECTGTTFTDTVIVNGSMQLGSIEDLQWSPSESTVVASASTDGTIGIWDLRSSSQQKPSLVINAHPGTDVNVISWSTSIQYLLLSGADDGSFCSWDLRNLKGGDTTSQALSTFTWHKHPITSVEWNPHEPSVVAVSDSHDQVTLWDLSLEPESVEKDEIDLKIPSQLIFIHQGLKQPKEIHWHPQIPGMVIGTGESGFNLFKTINV